MRTKTSGLFKILLSFMLIFALLPTAAHAAGYSDVPENFWGTEAIEALSDGGLLKGYGNGNFGPNDRLSVAQLATVITRICGGREYEKDGYYAYGALVYCRDALNCLPDLGEVKPGAYDDPCSRELAVFMLVNGLSDGHEFAVDPDFDPAVIPDYDSVSESYRDEVAVSYQNNIIVGVDAEGSFAPKLDLTRAQLAVVLYRIGILEASPVKGLGIPLKDQSEYTDEEIMELFYLITPAPTGDFIESPYTDEEFRSNILWLNRSGKTLLKLKYPAETTNDELKALLTAGIFSSEYYPEFGFRNIGSSSSRTTNRPCSVYLWLSADSDEEFVEHRTLAMREALKIRQRLYASGAMTERMTEKEKARVLFDELCRICRYDYTVDLSALSAKSPSHTPYSALCLGKAVCDGYAGAYNLLLRLEGIDCFGVYNDEHGWSAAYLDGTLYHIDVTYADTTAGNPYKYFAMDPDTSWEIHGR